MPEYSDKTCANNYNKAKPLHTDHLTWAALLARWMEFARSALALPDNDDGRRMRNSVVDIITLQAVWFALQHLDELDNHERALGLDRAEVLINKHADQLHKRWTDNQEIPEMLKELISDAKDQLKAASGSG